jgi:DNA-binding NtrC family response regulator
VLTVLFSSDAAHLERRLELERTRSVVIGRDPGGDGLAFADSLMSRVHFKVAYDLREGSYRFGDAGSRNGTLINGQRVDSDVLNDGDVLRAGGTVFSFSTTDATAEYDATVARVAPTDATVLIQGETGTGKELCARELHQQSGRSGPFVPVNCATLPRELIQAELFGHAKGAFSGAGKDRRGLFRAAEGGTLFLDEVGDLPMELQATLLRALQEKRIRPIGAEAEIAVDVRVVSATHIDLRRAAGEGGFRPDLFARLAQAIVSVPPLRERREMVLPLLKRFFGAPIELSPDAAEALLCWHFPLNVRELQALATYLSLHAPDAPLDARALRRAKPEIFEEAEEEPRPAAPRGPMKADELRERLQEHWGNVAAVAKDVGKPRAQVYRWMKAFGIEADEFRK